MKTCAWSDVMRGESFTTVVPVSRRMAADIKNPDENFVGFGEDHWHFACTKKASMIKGENVLIIRGKPLDRLVVPPHRKIRAEKHVPMVRGFTTPPMETTELDCLTLHLLDSSGMEMVGVELVNDKEVAETNKRRFQGPYQFSLIHFSQWDISAHIAWLRKYEPSYSSSSIQEVTSSQILMTIYLINTRGRHFPFSSTTVSKPRMWQNESTLLCRS